MSASTCPRPLPAPSRWMAALLAVSLTVLPGSWVGAQPVGLPSLGDVQGMSIAAERRLGDRIARDIYRDPDYLDDPVLGDYLQLIWQPLLGAARTRGDVAPELAERMAWELMISRDRRVNAFALPGGYLGVHLGLIAVTDNTGELASVMAHELSHVSQRHIARMLTRQDKMAPWMLGALILGALAARANTDVANAAIVGSQAVAAQTQLNFSRDMEREADRVGFGVMTDAGFDGLAFVTMFDKLQQASRLNDDGGFPYLRSHPLNSERIADMRARLPMGTASVAPGTAQLGPRRESSASPPTGGLVLDLPRASGTAAQLSPALHPLMAARAKVLAEKGTDRMGGWLQSGRGPQATAGDRYAAAWSAQRLGQPALALELAQKLREQVTPEVGWVVDALLIELHLAPNRGSSTGGASAMALKSLRDQALDSGSRALLMLGAQAAIATREPQLAASRLQSWVVVHPRDALAWETLARVHHAQGQTLRAIRAEAESRVAHLDYAGALERYRGAQAQPVAVRNADPMTMAIVDSRRRDVEQLLLALEKEEPGS
ncbi:M48 family metalloprotease [Hydrogenophaga sp.]|uniref:M48 family metalloprotease n=1 Tax=Hydrogenophaga sp. TaxID=1904254 RepID=UPI00271C3C3B|nr:M48 family metalloprotease [Hydrogenophaga sp.]MDO8903154.1 M48 family metalloprotease [Hydrogenophaga sp.]